MNIDRKLSALDDRIMELHRIDQAIRLGRLQGELMERERELNSRGLGPAPGDYPRTPEFRLQRHLEREHNRLRRAHAAR